MQEATGRAAAENIPVPPSTTPAACLEFRDTLSVCCTMWTCFLLTLAVGAWCAVGVAFASPVVPLQAPLFKQCDPSYGSTIMNGTITICDAGCAMSSLSMYLNSQNIMVDSQLPNPAVLNKWLRNNDGYVCDTEWKDFCADLNLPIVTELAPSRLSYLGENEMPSLPQMAKLVALQEGLILHVRNKTHFVLMVGFESSMDGTLYVNDPFFATSTYQWSDVADVIRYSVGKS